MQLFILLLLLLLLATPAVSRRPKAGADIDYSQFPGYSQPKKEVRHSEDCIERCAVIEEKKLSLNTVCNKYRRQSHEIGAVCTDSLLAAYKQVCLPACALEEDVASYKWPKVAKCTGLGSPQKLSACEHGFFQGVEQTVAALGVDVEKKKADEQQALADAKLAEEARVEHERLVAVRAKEQARIAADKEKRERDGVAQQEHTFTGTEHADDGKSEAFHESEERAAQLIKEASERAALAHAEDSTNIEHYFEFSFLEKQHVIPLPFDANIPDLVVKFCRTYGIADLGGCSREVLMEIRMTYPGLL
jgi:hypothetical protein